MLRYIKFYNFSIIKSTIGIIKKMKVDQCATGDMTFELSENEHVKWKLPAFSFDIMAAN